LTISEDFTERKSAAFSGGLREDQMVRLAPVAAPQKEEGLVPVPLTSKTVATRKEAVLSHMQQEGYDVLVIYADLEHGSNWEYLTGFLPRFEESLLVLWADGTSQLVLGNENLNKSGKALIENKPVHMPHFSLPNQPMETGESVEDTLAETGIQHAGKIGIVGWKLFTSSFDDNAHMYDIPAYLMDALVHICPKAEFSNATHIFIGADGVRTVNNANEFAHYEFGAALAGNSMLAAMDAVVPGVTEMELGGLLNSCGQRNSVVTIAAAGERFIDANMYPTDHTVSVGDPISLTVGYKGGLQSRSAFAVHDESELPEGQHDWLQKVAIPYQTAVKAWIESIHVGMTGGELYNVVDSVLPKKAFGWKLNPGHLCADEEWLCSPVFPGSTTPLRSGMLFQIDIIPSVPGYNGACCESGVLLADEELRGDIAVQYPELWKRVQSRQAYMRDELGIDVPDEVLPTSSMTAYLRPHLLDQTKALRG